MRFTQLRDFLQVVDSGGVRAAARRLGVSQPALTKSVHQLESELCIPLLQRSTRGVSLTPAGKTFAIRARAIQSELMHAQEELASFTTSDKESVAIGMAPLAAMLLLPPALVRFRAAFPVARVRVVEGSPAVLLPMLREQSLDLVVTKRFTNSSDASIRVRPLLRAPLVIAARHGHPLASATHLGELVGAQWLVFSPLGDPGTVFNGLFQREDLPVPRAAIQTESYATALAVLAHTDTLGIVSPSLLGETWGGCSVRQIQVAQQVPSITLSLYSRTGSPPSGTGTAMTKALSAVAREVAVAHRTMAPGRARAP